MFVAIPNSKFMVHVQMSYRYLYLKDKNKNIICTVTVNNLALKIITTIIHYIQIFSGDKTTNIRSLYQLVSSL